MFVTGLYVVDIVTETEIFVIVRGVIDSAVIVYSALELDGRAVITLERSYECEGSRDEDLVDCGE